jgi:uncharacterized protein (DUF736 family)
MFRVSLGVLVCAEREIGASWRTVEDIDHCGVNDVYSVVEHCDLTRVINLQILVTRGGLYNEGQNEWDGKLATVVVTEDMRWTKRVLDTVEAGISLDNPLYP